jgi:dethiobiotin synthetase
MITKNPLFITGIGTDIGKTIASAILVEKLQADYWKPVQSGDLHRTDTMKVQALITNSISKFHPETYRLTQPFSPHKSAQLDNLQINLNEFDLPQTSNRLLIEGAGGLMVPLNSKDMVVDLVQRLKADVVLIVKHYLGSINHTLLSLELLKQRGIKLHSIIYNGPVDEYSEAIINNYSSNIARIEQLDKLDKQSISRQAQLINFEV